MTKLNMHYQWEMEEVGGKVVRQFENDGTENSWKKLDPKKVVRISFLPRIPSLPRHDVFIDHSAGEEFIRRFGRGFLKQKLGFNLGEYIHCAVTNKYRFWVFSTGRTLVTEKDYEVYV